MSSNDKELYRQKFQAQLDEWKADIDKLKAKAKTAKADAQLDLNKLVDKLEHNLRLADSQLAEVSRATEATWDTVKRSAQSSWDTLKKSMHDTLAKFSE